MGGWSWSLRRRRLVVGVTIAVFSLLTAQAAAAVDGAWPQAHHDPSGTDANPEVTTITPRTVTTLRPVWRSTPTFGYYGGATVAGGVA